MQNGKRKAAEKKLSGKCCTGLAAEAIMVHVTTIHFGTFGFALQSDPQPFGTDFMAQLKNRFIEKFKEALHTTTKIELETTIRVGDFVMQPYLKAKRRGIRKCMARFRSGSHWLEIQRGRFTKPRTERENRLCKQYNLGVAEDEARVVFVGPLYATLRVKYSDLFLGAMNLNSAFRSAIIAFNKAFSTTQMVSQAEEGLKFAASMRSLSGTWSLFSKSPPRGSVQVD